VGERFNRKSDGLFAAWVEGGIWPEVYSVGIFGGSTEGDSVVPATPSLLPLDVARDVATDGMFTRF
jgi:hypothetical protein